MDCIRIPFSVIPPEPLSSPLPDGDYTLVRFRSLNEDNFGSHPNPFPWLGVVVRFSGGTWTELCRGSNLADLLGQRGIKEVLVIDSEMSINRRRELAEMLAVKNIELIDV